MEVQLLYLNHLLLSSSGDADEEGPEEQTPNCFDYFMHILCVFWKICFAFVPPTQYWNGWACFLVSICVIGMLTAVIGDLASHFGCTVGLRDGVTAVVFVALGTSVPGKQVTLFQMVSCVTDDVLSQIAGSLSLNFNAPLLLVFLS